METEPPIFIVSDSTGETAEKVVRASLLQFPQRRVRVRLFTRIRDEAALEAVLREASEKSALVVFTLVKPELRETFLRYHREIRENRAKAAELDFLIDRIVFKLFDLTLDEQKLILSRVGPGRPLPPRRGKKHKPPASGDGTSTLFET